MNLELDIESIGGQCPVQAEGSINDKRFYFRARGSMWTLAIAATDDACLDDEPEKEYIGAYSEPASYDAGWMSHDEAVAIIRCCAQQYVAERFQNERNIAYLEALRNQVGACDVLDKMIAERKARKDA